MADLIALLTKAQESVCSLKCPSTWKTAEGRPPHHEECRAISDAINAARPEGEAQEAKRYRAWRDGDVIVRGGPLAGWEARHESTPHWDVGSWHWSESLDEAMDKALSEPIMNSCPDKP